MTIMRYAWGTKNLDAITLFEVKDDFYFNSNDDDNYNDDNDKTMMLSMINNAITTITMTLTMITMMRPEMAMMQKQKSIRLISRQPRCSLVP